MKNLFIHLQIISVLFFTLYGYNIRTVTSADLEDAITVNTVFRIEYEIPHIYQTLYRNLHTPTIASAYEKVQSQLKKDSEAFEAIISGKSKTQFLIGAFEHESHSCFAFLHGEICGQIVIIRHLAVFKQMREKGVERALIKYIQTVLKPKTMLIRLWYTDDNIRMQLEDKEDCDFEFSTSFPEKYQSFFEPSEEGLYSFGILEKEYSKENS